MEQTLINRPTGRVRSGREVYSVLTLPAALPAVLFIALPLLLLGYQSFLTHDPGKVGASADLRYSLDGYKLILGRPYLPYILDTLRLSAVSAAFAVILGSLLGYRIARTASQIRRKTLLGFLLGLTFLSILVRVYALSITFGVAGPAGSLLRHMGINLASRGYAEFMIMLGFLHFLIPISALILVGTFSSIPTSFYEAACSLGAARWKAHLDTTVRMALSGLYSCYILAFGLAVSSFVIPLILGQGKIQFLANLAYIRFGEMADYPGGAAISIVLLTISLLIIAVLGKIVSVSRSTMP